MPTVAVLFEFPTLLGGERSWFAALPAIREAGFAPLAFAPAAGPLADELKSRGVPHIAWSTSDSTGRRLDHSSLHARLRELLCVHKPDLVHANSLSMTRLVAPVAREQGLPGLGHVRDIVRLSRTAVRDVNCMPRLLAVSHAARSFHVDQGVDPARIQVLYNGVDLEEFAPRPAGGELDRDIGLGPSDLVVVAVGQVGLRKGTDVFVELARCVLQRRRDVHFLIVGERTSNKDEALRLTAAVQEAAEQPPCRGNVHLLGTRRDMPQILARADLVVHAARQEPLGRVLLESAAAGKPIIASDVGGTREIFPRESAAAVIVPPCEPRDVERAELLAATIRLLNDRAARQELGLAARRRAEEEFDAHRYGRKLTEHYAGMLRPSTTAP